MNLPSAKTSSPLFDALLSAPDATDGIQREAAARVRARGLPTRRDERWRYSDLRALGGRALHARAAGVHLAADGALAPVGFPVAFEITTLDGVPQTVPMLPAGVTISLLERQDPASAAAFALALPTDDAFGDLNSALVTSALRLEIGAAARLGAPILITHHLSATHDVAVHPRLIVALAPGARAQVIERFIGAEGADGLCNAITRLTLGAGSQLDHLHWQDQPDGVTHLALLDAVLQSGATLTQRALHFGAALGRFAGRIELAGSDAAAELFALNAVDGRRRCDLQLEVRHAAGKTRSRQHYRGVAGGRGKAAATSRAVVARDAAGCDAAQSLGSLLLSRHAEADARPELEIENDDVRCSHGATIGQLDEASLFYLRSRGLSEAEARAALVFAFADAVLTTLPRGVLREALEARLRDRIGTSAAP